MKRITAYGMEMGSQENENTLDKLKLIQGQFNPKPISLRSILMSTYNLLSLQGGCFPRGFPIKF
jgi:hypothetical protein